MKKGLILISILTLCIFLMEGFQCSSPEKTTAKLAIKSGEYSKAKQTILKEIAKNPKDFESLFILAEAEQNLEEYPEAAKTIVDAEKYAANDIDKKQVAVFKANLATNCDEKSRSLYNKFMQTQNQKTIDSSLMLIDAGLLVRPERPDFWMIKGLILENKNDTSGAIAAYEKYSELLKFELMMAKEKKIYLNMQMKEALKLLKVNPEKTIPFIVEQDTLHIDIIKYGMGPAYLYSIKTPKDNDFMLIGWDVNPPMSWIPQEILLPKEMSLRPFLKLILLYGLTNNLDKAMENINKVFILDPKNQSAKDFLLNIYQIQGKVDDAISYINTLIKENPQNASYYSILGNLYLQSQQYEKAIESYYSALKIDSKDLQAIRNLGPAHKNIFVTKQREQRNIRQSNPNAPDNTEEMIQILKTSATHFEKALKMNEFKYDYDAYADLIEIYTVLKENDKKDQWLASLESIENSIPNDKKADYYNRLVKIYDRLGNQETDSDELKQKIKQKLDYYQEQFNKFYK